MDSDGRVLTTCSRWAMFSFLHEANIYFFYIKCLLVIPLEHKLGSRADPGLDRGAASTTASNYLDQPHLGPPPLLLPPIGLGAAFKSLPWSLPELGCMYTDSGLANLTS